MPKQISKTQPRSIKSKGSTKIFSFIGMAVLLLVVVGIVSALLLLKNQTDNRSNATSSRARTGWLGLAVNWVQLESDQAKVLSSIRATGTPWVYDWKMEANRIALFGEAYTPMMYECSTDSGFAKSIDRANSWPKKGGYLLFLNEPDQEGKCSPELAARRLRTLISHPKRDTRTKIIIAGGLHGPKWLGDMLASYRSQFGSNPDIAGIHVHMYAAAPSGTAMSEVSGGQLYNNAKTQFEKWSTFREREGWLSSKEFWITETGVLSADVRDSEMSVFMKRWFNYLEKQSFVNRAYWFVDNVSSSRSDLWAIRSSALYRNLQPTSLELTFKEQCDKYCPKLPPPTVTASKPTATPTSNQRRTVTPTPRTTPNPSSLFSAPSGLSVSCGKNMSNGRKEVTFKWNMTGLKGDSYYIGINKANSCRVNGVKSDWFCGESSGKGDLELPISASACNSNGACQFKTAIARNSWYSNYAISAFKAGQARQEGKSTAGFICN